MPVGIFQQLLNAITGTLTTRAPAPTSATGTIGALNAGVVLAVPQGATAVTFFSVGVMSATLTAQITFDGVTWLAIACSRGDAQTSPTTNVNVNSSPCVVALPVGVTHVRARCTAYTSGSVTTTIAIGTANTLPPVQQLILAASGNAIGFTNAGATWYDDSSTPLAAGATFTGTSRDSVLATSGTALTNGSARVKEVRCCAISDVAGTLHLEVSRDNTTFRRVESVATSAVGSLQIAKIKYEPFTRYFRFVFVNGGTAQAHFMQQIIAMAA